MKNLQMQITRDESSFCIDFDVKISQIDDLLHKFNFVQAFSCCWASFFLLLKKYYLQMNKGVKAWVINSHKENLVVGFCNLLVEALKEQWARIFILSSILFFHFLGILFMV